MRIALSCIRIIESASRNYVSPKMEELLRFSYKLAVTVGNENNKQLLIEENMNKHAQIDLDDSFGVGENTTAPLQPSLIRTEVEMLMSEVIAHVVERIYIRDEVELILEDLCSKVQIRGVLDELCLRVEGRIQQDIVAEKEKVIMLRKIDEVSSLCISSVLEIILNGVIHSVGIDEVVNSLGDAEDNDDNEDDVESAATYEEGDEEDNDEEDVGGDFEDDGGGEVSSDKALEEEEEEEMIPDEVHEGMNAEADIEKVAQHIAIQLDEQQQAIQQISEEEQSAVSKLGSIADDLSRLDDDVISMAHDSPVELVRLMVDMCHIVEQRCSEVMIVETHPTDTDSLTLVGDDISDTIHNDASRGSSSKLIDCNGTTGSSSSRVGQRDKDKDEPILGCEVTFMIYVGKEQQQIHGLQDIEAEDIAVMIQEQLYNPDSVLHQGLYSNAVVDVRYKVAHRRKVFQKWESFWVHLIHPTFFGYSALPPKRKDNIDPSDTIDGRLSSGIVPLNPTVLFNERNKATFMELCKKPILKEPGVHLSRWQEIDDAESKSATTVEKALLDYNVDEFAQYNSKIYRPNYNALTKKMVLRLQRQHKVGLHIWLTEVMLLIMIILLLLMMMLMMMMLIMVIMMMTMMLIMMIMMMMTIMMMMMMMIRRHSKKNTKI